MLSWQLASSQEIVRFKTSDNLQITADLYETESQSDKWMIMTHQAEFSRGEFKEAARRMIKLGYNCLAIDLRSGGEVNYVPNETAALAKELGFPQTFLDCEKDILAAIDYVYSRSKNAQLTLFGSSFSASLCLKIAKERSDIYALILFSPGEFFEPKISMKQTANGLKIPIFAGCPKSEYSYVKELLSGVKSPKLVIFKPDRGEGLHGSKTLWWESSTRNEFWLSLLFFLKGM